MSQHVHGLDPDAVGGWLTEHVPRVRLPLRAELITGGHSNLTYALRDQSGVRWVLRRPPLHGLLPSAHDMAREHMILDALEATGVPVPRTVGLCEDTSVIGAPFYVTEFVDGTVVRRVDQVVAFDEAARARLGAALIEVLARLHGLDPRAVGLGALVRRTPYVERQLRRWRGQLEAASASRDLTVALAVHERLCTAMPQGQDEDRINHGDFRLDNVIIGTDGEVRAVLDWELCAVGDPLADLGIMLAYWAESGEPSIPFLAPTTAVSGFPTRQGLVRLYAERTGRDVGAIGYYESLGLWKVGVIAEGVAARYESGAMGQQANRAEEFWAAADSLFDRAAAIFPP